MINAWPSAFDHQSFLIIPAKISATPTQPHKISPSWGSHPGDALGSHGQPWGTPCGLQDVVKQLHTCHFYVVLETHCGNTVVTEKLADGSTTWVGIRAAGRWGALVVGGWPMSRVLGWTNRLGRA